MAKPFWFPLLFVTFPTSFTQFHFHSTLELICALILKLCVNFDLSLFSTAQTNTLSCTQFGIKLGSENNNYERSQRQSRFSSLPTQGPLKKYGMLNYIGNISGLTVLARHSLGSSHLKRFPALVVNDDVNDDSFFSTICMILMWWGCVLGGGPGWESVGSLLRPVGARFWRCSDTRTVLGYSSRIDKPARLTIILLLFGYMCFWICMCQK